MWSKSITSEHVCRETVLGEKLTREKKILFFVVPVLIVIILYVAIMGYSIYASFTNQSLIGPAAKKPEFVGMRNYIRILSDPDFFHSLKVSWLFTIGGGIVGQSVLGLALAVILKQKGIKGKAFVSTVVIMCWVIPDIVGAFIMGSFWAKAGLFNDILGVFGKSPIVWLSNYPLETVIISNIWKGTGWSLLLFSAALETIPQEYYDAADVDGASSWYKFKTVTFPLALPVIIINIFLITIWTYGYFPLVFTMTHGGPGMDTMIYPIFVYREAFEHYSIGYGSALSWVNIIIISIMCAGYLLVLRRRG